MSNMAGWVQSRKGLVNETMSGTAAATTLNSKTKLKELS